MNIIRKALFTYLEELLRLLVTELGGDDLALDSVDDNEIIQDRVVRGFFRLHHTYFNIKADPRDIHNRVYVQISHLGKTLFENNFPITSFFTEDPDYLVRQCRIERILRDMEPLFPVVPMEGRTERADAMHAHVQARFPAPEGFSWSEERTQNCHSSTLCKCGLKYLQIGTYTDLEVAFNWYPKAGGSRGCTVASLLRVTDEVALAYIDAKVQHAWDETF